MIKNTLLIALVLVASTSFQIRTDETPSPAVVQVDQPFNSIPWPFTLCGDGDWTIESVTLGQTPKRNVNDDIDVVDFYLL